MTHAALKSRLILLLALPLLAACSALSAIGGATAPLQAYDLRAPEGAPVAQGRPLARDVIVEIPTTSGVLDTDRILIRPDPLQAQYLPDVRWGETTPVMLQTLMLRSLGNTGGIRYVGRRPLGGSGDFAIVTELIDFQAELTAEGTPLIRLRMTTTMVRESDASIVSNRTLSATAQAASTETPALIAAFDAASDQLMISFAEWALGALGRRLTPA
jgi:cholesterol transport system auxiliary component